MTSFMKSMFKGSSKKGNSQGNKENYNSKNLSLLNSSNLRSSKRTDQVYVGDPAYKFSQLSAANPYSVVTAPKTTRGPRSCPGAPMEDFSPRDFGERRSQLNSSQRYANLMDHKKSKDDYAIDRRSDYGSGSSGPSPIEFNASRQYRNGNYYNDQQAAVAQYNHDMYESDEDDVYKEKIRSLEEKLRKMARRFREERRVLNERIENAENVYYKLEDAYNRMEKHHLALKRKYETEKKQMAEMTRMLAAANDKLTMLERERGDESNTSSLLCAYNGGDGLTSGGGAGEALCFPEASISNQFSIFSNQKMLVNHNPNSLKDDADMQDEVRIFRTVESGKSSPLEMARCGGSPFDVPSYVNDCIILQNKETIEEDESQKSAHNRSLSDSNLFVTSQRDEIQPIVEDFMTIPPRKKDLIKRGSALRVLEEESSSDEEDAMNLIEKQLRKRGDVVKFNPPRQTVQPRHYRRFGKNERNALAEFEYLQDIPTDVSGMMSSPEVNQQFFGKAATLPRS